MMIVHECEQGSPEWFARRMGIPTASEFSTILAKGKGDSESKTRLAYMRKLAGEVLTGEPMDSYTNVHMERGKAQEDEARNFYCFERDCDVTRVGFVTNGNKGCSPDSLIGDIGGLEIKTALAHIQIERLEKNELPPEHKAQVQGSIWICERDWWDFVSYSPRLPLLIVRVQRDDGYIANLAGAVDKFNTELNELVDRIRRYGEPISEAA